MELEIKQDIEIVCSVCGTELDADQTGKYAWSIDVLKITPCEVCISNAVEKAIEEVIEK